MNGLASHGSDAPQMGSTFTITESAATLESLFGADERSPEEVYRIWHQRSTPTPEVKLRLAMIAAAVLDLQSPKVAIREDARWWILTKTYRDVSWITFTEACEAVGWSPGWLQRLLKGKEWL